MFRSMTNVPGTCCDTAHNQGKSCAALETEQACAMGGAQCECNRGANSF